MGDNSESPTTLSRGSAWRDRAAFDRLLPTVYGELRRLAAFHLRKERPDHTFGPTELISEAYLRLVDGVEPELSSRARFFAIASRCMRQVLVDHARKRCAEKRGAGIRPAELDENQLEADPPELPTAWRQALEKLAAFDARKARITELHYVNGLTQEQIAVLCGVHVNTVARALRTSEAWLRHHYRDEM
jgi:RNA polymerase sigma factor (TIGR02999 family)